MADSNYIFEPKKKDLKADVQRTVHHLPAFSIEYVKSLFPIFSWIGRYNTTWLLGDLIAGITVGLVVIPQSMAYAKVAALPVEYGLYSSFVGVTIYCLFATSKDMTIGPTAVMSLLIGQTLTAISSNKDNAGYSNPTIAATFSLLAGLIVLLFGLLRLGIVVRFVSNPVIAGFTTGSAINITISQLAGLLGITGIDTRAATYLVLGNTLKALGRTTVDAAAGLTCLLFLYSVKFGMSYLTTRYSNRQKIFFFISTLRNFLAVVIYTIIAFILNIGKTTNPLSILKTMPSGLHDVGVKDIDTKLLSICGPYLPGICIVLVLEHIAIAKSFGRINDYRIAPSQECIAIGATNCLGCLFGAYPATGSFSRSAIKSKSGVLTPFAGIFSGLLVLLAIYALTPAFYYIPNAALKYVYHIVADFNAVTQRIIKVGIYVSVGFSLAITLLRISRPKFETLGRIAIASLDDKSSNKYAYVPSVFEGAQSPPSGILIFRIDQELTYPNADYIEDEIINHVKTNTRRMSEMPKRANDLPWNEAKVTYESKIQENSALPPLKAIIFDFSAVCIVDSTAVQILVNVKRTINRYAGSEVEYHFATILNEPIQKSLIIAGFGSADQKALLVDVGTNTAKINDLESKHSVEIKKSMETKKSEEVSEVVIDSSEDSTATSGGNKFFHLSVEAAVIAATNGTW
ncbi:2164_t:CDS:2 [Cetraspora pellucida]|uniref:2164_t:CDS:1 n=1 Tax=Cetraspora pellucida TaxID=1433469 RepID=A0A9N9HQC4_9GLOM|nr:2164_t:CDS:2 [Cetraspora pellucida]